jgi:hypothetical protein
MGDVTSLSQPDDSDIPSCVLITVYQRCQAFRQYRHSATFTVLLFVTRKRSPRVPGRMQSPRFMQWQAVYTSFAMITPFWSCGSLA